MLGSVLPLLNLSHERTSVVEIKVQQDRYLMYVSIPHAWHA